MTAATKDTIVIVHGTFSGPKDAGPQWWQDNARGSFIFRLDRSLAERGVEARCWTHVRVPDFHWSGDNDWVARATASAHLVQYLSQLARDGWRCHLIGHSHGGNVITQAMSALHGTAGERAVASVTTLGTPFLDAGVDVDAHKRKSRWLAASFVGLGALPIGALPLVLDAQTLSTDVLVLLAVTLGLVVATLSVMLTALLRDRARRKRAKQSPAIPGLALNTPFDEAWQLLHHVRTAPDPIAVQGGLWRYLRQRMRGSADRRLSIEQAVMPFDVAAHVPNRWLTWLYRSLYSVILAATAYPIWQLGWSWTNAFVGLALGIIVFAVIGASTIAVGLGSMRHAHAFFRPLNAAVWWVASVKVVPSEVITYLVRKRSWDLLQRWVLGLDGYRFALPAVGTIPSSAGAVKFQFEPLGSQIVDRARRARTEWLMRHVEGVTDVFGKAVLSAADAQRLLADIEQDASLVHAAYYVDDDAVERIAQWIADHSSAPMSSAA